jgi:alkanesulfonate monooxygenase SsuD/methylene tetrahydromethanopterin reductase-like flavin-dependent oxidoreductase (luciferase family)
MEQVLELGLDTFGDVTEGADGEPISYAQVIRDVIEEAVLADELGADFIGVGEHHRDDFAVSSPEVVLSAIAGQTSRIHVGSAVTVMSSDDPVRVLEWFATLVAASNGRAEVILCRGSFTESFPLFGYELSQYEELFEEKVNLFAELLTEQPVIWHGRTRSGLANQRVYPRTESGHLKTWIGVGGSPTRSLELLDTRCRPCWPSSAATPCGSVRLLISTAEHLSLSRPPSCPWASTHRATSPMPMNRPEMNCGPT